MSEFFDIKTRTSILADKAEAKSLSDIMNSLKKSGEVKENDIFSLADKLNSHAKLIANAINSKISARNISVQNISVSDDEMLKGLVLLAEKQVNVAIKGYMQDGNNQLTSTLNNLISDISKMSYLDSSLRNNGDILMTHGNSRVK